MVKITEKCISCGICADECPQSCINKGDSKYVIDNDACVECELCVGSCPESAIVVE